MSHATRQPFNAEAASNPVTRAQQDEPDDLLERARLHWPRLESPRNRAIRRDPRRMAAYVAHRTALPAECIRVLLEPR